MLVAHNKTDGSDDDYQVACLLLAFLAFSLSRIVRREGSIYDVELDAFHNNIHCLSKTLSVLFPSLFQLCGRHDIDDRMKEFLAL